MQARMAPKGLRCPFCGVPAFPAPVGFLELGEYNGRKYAVEGDVEGLQCPNGHGFYVWPEGKAITTGDLLPSA